MNRLADMTVDLGNMFQKHGYDDASCFGHALEGNLHLVFSQVRCLTEWRLRCYLQLAHAWSCSAWCGGAYDSLCCVYLVLPGYHRGGQWVAAERCKQRRALREC